MQVHSVLRNEQNPLEHALKLCKIDGTSSLYDRLQADNQPMHKIGGRVPCVVKGGTIYGFLSPITSSERPASIKRVKPRIDSS